MPIKHLVSIANAVMNLHGYKFIWNAHFAQFILKNCKNMLKMKWGKNGPKPIRFWSMQYDRGQLFPIHSNHLQYEYSWPCISITVQGLFYHIYNAMHMRIITTYLVFYSVSTLSWLYLKSSFITNLCITQYDCLICQFSCSKLNKNKTNIFKG